MPPPSHDPLEQLAVVDFLTAKQQLEKYAYQYNQQLPPETLLGRPMFEKNEVGVEVVFGLQSPYLRREQLLDVIDFALTTYDHELFTLVSAENNYALSNALLSSLKQRRLLSFSAHYTPEADGFSPKEGHVHIDPVMVFRLAVEKGFIEEDLHFVQECYHLLADKLPQQSAPTLETLMEMGLGVETPETELSWYSWDSLAGYHEVKEEVYWKVIVPQFEKDFFQNLRKLTRAVPQQKSYNCYLFSGNPGVGKTDMARIVAAQMKRPLVTLSLDAFLEKWYGDSPKKLQHAFRILRQIGPVVFFLDEIDCLFGDREGYVHEETKKTLSVLMTEMAKTKEGDDLLVIAASNKVGTLDEALKRRLHSEIRFPDPSREDLLQIYHHYAQQLDQPTLRELVDPSEGFSPFDVMQACQNAEQLFRREQEEAPSGLPEKRHYLLGIENSRKNSGKRKKARVGF